MTTDAKTLQDQGVKLFDQHDYEAAARLFQQAKDQYATDGQHDMVAEMKVNIGLVHRALGENQQALEMIQEALRTFQDHKDELRTAQALGNLGGVYSALNDKEQAFNAYRQASEIFLKLDEKRLYSETMLALGALQIRSGKLFNGAAYYQVGLEGLESVNDLSFTQKIIKRLFTTIAGLNGTAKPS